LDITLEKSTATEGLIKIRLKEADYQSIFEEKVKKYSKQASIKGFRPGKVPPALVKKMYGKAILVEEINSLLVESLKKYILENDINLIGEPLPNHAKAEAIDWDNQKEFDFEYNVGLIDDFKYDLNQQVTRYEIEVNQKEVDQMIADMQKQLGKMEHPEVSEAGDSLFGTLTVASSEVNAEGLIELDNTTQSARSLLTGHKKGDKITLAVQSIFEKPEDLAVFLNKPLEEVKELQGDASFEVQEVNRLKHAELNQELFDRVFGKDVVKSEEEFHAKYKEMLAENLSKESDYLLSRDLQNKLMENTNIDLPEAFYREWLVAANDNIKEEDLADDFQHYIRDLKWTLLKNRIAQDHSIQVEYEDVVEATKKMFMDQYGLRQMGPEAEESLNQLAGNYLQQGKGEQFYKMHNQLKTEKILAVAKEKADISVKKVSREEFDKLVEN
jgi:trigger factor